jgi:hypothetical protein
MTLGAPAVGSRARPFLLGAAGVGALLLLSNDDGPVLCPFRRITGIPCAGCGLTRCAGELARFDVAGAVGVHPLGPLVLAQLVVVLVLWLVRPERVRERWVVPLVVANGVLLFVVWLVRLALGDLPV